MSEEKRERILNVDGVCDYLKASRSTVYKLSQNGMIPCSKVGRMWRFDRDQIDAWLRSQEGAQVMAQARSEESGGGASGRRGAGGGENASRALEDLGLTEKQLETLRAFSLTTPTHLFVSMSTEAGRRGLRAALGMTAEQLDEFATKLTANLNK